jgi:hypothetical protein
MADPQTPVMKPDSTKRCYVAVRDPSERTSAHTTVYGLSPAQVIEALRLGIEAFKHKHLSEGPAQKKTSAARAGVTESTAAA